MKAIVSPSGESLFLLQAVDGRFLTTATQFSQYTILFLWEGAGIYQADFATFPFKAPVLLFATPFQQIHIKQRLPISANVLQFHGDFYCIEFHRSEVACNGLLFNNIYLQPFVHLTAAEAATFKQLLAQMNEELQQHAPAEIVLKAYLQLLLAKSSSIKMKSLATTAAPAAVDEQMEQFRQLLDQHYLALRKTNDYAQLLAMSPDNLSKRCKRYFKKTPTQLIQERLILQAKKLLHLTRKSIKEIAYELKFEDEFYFSRVFKKFTQVSPQTFRQETGISVVADLSM